MQCIKPVVKCAVQQVGCLSIVFPLQGFNYHLLAPLSRWLYMQYQASFTLHPRTMLNVRSWIVHLTPISCSTFALIQSGFHTSFIPRTSPSFPWLARDRKLGEGLGMRLLPHCVLSGFFLVKVACSPCTWKCGSAQQSVMGRTKWPATYT